jgi:hypothetical protein
VVVVCLVVLGVRFSDTSGSFGDRAGLLFTGSDDSAVAGGADDPRTRELVMSQANQFMLRINTYGPSDLDKQNKMPGYVERVSEVITPKLDAEFEKQVTLAEQSVAQAGLARSIALYATGLDAVDTDVASVLVTGAITQSYPDPTKKGRIEYEPLVFRYQVSLVKTGGSWLVDDFAPVKGEVAGEPTDGVPTQAPSSPQTVDPTGAAASPVASRYAEIVAKRQVGIVAAVDTLDTCGLPDAAPAGDASCAAAPGALTTAVRSLANSLAGAANPDSRVFVGAPPAGIADLLSTTTSAASGVLDASAALRGDCLTDEATRCADQRAVLVAALNTLTQALRGWGSVS